jgi:methionyl-tRNA formyltransferase
MLRVVFFGTPELATTALSGVLESGIEVPLVVSQPDRPAGRHSTPLPSAVSRLAAVRKIPLSKPERLRGNAGFLGELRRAAPDVGVVVSYGRLLPTEVLELPRLGFVNVHASLLPKYRGATPIQAALMAGDRETGVVTMRVVEELDAGPIYLERRVQIREGEDAGSLTLRLAAVGTEILLDTLKGLEAGVLKPRPQEGEPSYSRPIDRMDAEVDWTLPAERIERWLRAYTPWPGLHTFLRGERIKVLRVDSGRPVLKEPGTLWQEEDVALVAAGGGTSLILASVQREGRKPVTGAEFARGLPELPMRFDPRSATPAS